MSVIRSELGRKHIPEGGIDVKGSGWELLWCGWSSMNPNQVSLSRGALELVGANVGLSLPVAPVDRLRLILVSTLGPLDQFYKGHSSADG